jgi:two-component system NtrC family sensor kinase
MPYQSPNRQDVEELLKHSEERYRNLVANIPGAVYRCVYSSQLLRTMAFLSEAIQEISGYPPSDFINNRVRSFASIIHPQDRAKVEQALSQSISNKQPYEIEYRIVKADGSIAWVYDKGRGIFDESEETQIQDLPIQIDGVILEITKRKQTEADLHYTQTFLNSVLENLPVAVFIKDALELRVMYWNKASEDLFGYSREEVLGKNDYNLLSKKQANYLQTKDRKVITAGQLVEISEAPILTPHRGERFLHSKQVPLLDETGIPRYILGICEDITEQKALWEAQRKSETHYRRLLETASEGIWMFDADSKTTFANSRIAQMLGYTVAEMQGRSLFDFMDEESREQAQTYANRRRQGLHERHDFKFRRQDGSDLWAIVSATPILDAKGQFVGVLRMITDISDRKNTEEALRKSESQLRAKNQELEQTLLQLQKTQALVIQNEKMASLGQMVAGIAHEINNPVSFIYGNLTYARQYTTDLLSLIQLYNKHYPETVPEIQQEMALVGLNFIKKDFPKLLNSMEEGANRIRQIVLSLRNFSRLDEADKKKVNIHEGINSTLLILQHKLKKQDVNPEIQVIQEYGQLPPVECYPSQLNQVFMNILSNAIDAIDSQAQPGKITISTTLMTQEEGDKRMLSSVQFPPPHTEPAYTSLALPKIKTFTYIEEQSKSLALGTQDHFSSPQSVMIRITDNGPGIPENIKKHIFDPFFTTKPVGLGTGLGLSIAYSIVVEKHGGKLTCISTPGQGTEFIIELPIQQKQFYQKNGFQAPVLL